MKKISLILLLCSTLLACKDSETIENIEAGVDSQVLSNWLITGENTEVWERMTSNAKSDFGTYADFDSFQQTLVSQLGPKTSDFKLNVFINSDIRYAETMSSFSNLPDGTQGALLWVMNGNAKKNIDSVSFRLVLPEVEANYSYEYQGQTEFVLPFKDEMVVLWGGSSTFENYHADTNAQRYAIDFLVFENGRYFSKTGARNEDHFCWGKTVLAPGFGKVISVANDIHDNDIPIENDVPEEYLGNHVAIDHGNGEYSIVAHLKQGSVDVVLDQFVSSGDPIGKCGNSGLSDLPHIHFHVQDTPDFLDIVGSHGIPPRFLGIYKNGQRNANTLIERGERVSNEQ